MKGVLIFSAGVAVGGWLTIEFIDLALNHCPADSARLRFINTLMDIETREAEKGHFAKEKKDE